MIRKFLPRGLFARSLLILIIPLLFVQIITTTVFFDNHWRNMTERLSDALVGDVVVLSSMLKKEQVEEAERYSNAFDIFISSQQPQYKINNGSFHFWEEFALNEFEDGLSKALEVPYNLSPFFDEKRILLNMTINNETYWMEIPVRRLFSSSGYIVLLWMMGTSLLMLIIAVLFMRNQIRPIYRLAIAAERFGKGGDMPGFKPSGATEVRRAAQAFLTMRERIKRQIEQRTLMLAGVSHDLRTPLTRMALQLEMMGDIKDIKTLKRNINDMKRMIDGYIDFARGVQDEPATSNDMNDIAQSVIQKRHCDTADIQFNPYEKPIYVMIKPLAIQRCIDNLVGNAVHHADHVWVSISSEPDMCIITIDDDGIGISEDHYDDVFKPFFRVDKARQGEGRSGLGLSIAQDIVHSHGGSIALSTSDKGGLCVAVSIPL